MDELDELEYFQTTPAFEALARDVIRKEYEWKYEPDKPGDFYGCQLPFEQQLKIVNQFINEQVCMYCTHRDILLSF